MLLAKQLFRAHSGSSIRAVVLALPYFWTIHAATANNGDHSRGYPGRMQVRTAVGNTSAQPL